VLAAAVEQRRAADGAEAQLLRIAAHWADLHAALPGAAASGFTVEPPAGGLIGGLEQMVPLAGAGAPEVAEFAPAELGAALSISSAAAMSLVGDALELRHRLPRLWARVLDGRLPAWRARQVADHTKSLSPEAAAYVDAQVEAVAHEIGLHRVLRLVDVAIARFDPETAAERERAAADSRGVWTSEEVTDGTRSVHIEADALDVTVFEERIDEIAEALGRLGDSDRADVRRAKAVGVIADPQGTLELLHGQERAATARCSSRPRATVYVHLSEASVRGRSGVARVEGLGPATLELVRQWLGRSDVTLTPVLDLHNRAAVDAYEAPDAMREAVLLRSPCCPFPWCNNLSRTKDMDHIVPFVPPDEGGPPGQTAPHLLGPLCRRHHRYKTHGGWTYSMPEPGFYLWRSPLGRHYQVDGTGTTQLDLPA
jgi:hypothetical protein